MPFFSNPEWDAAARRLLPDGHDYLLSVVRSPEFRTLEALVDQTVQNMLASGNAMRHCAHSDVIIVEDVVLYAALLSLKDELEAPAASGAAGQMRMDEVSGNPHIIDPSEAEGERALIGARHVTLWQFLPTLALLLEAAHSPLTWNDLTHDERQAVYGPYIASLFKRTPGAGSIHPEHLPGGTRALHPDLRFFILACRWSTQEAPGWFQRFQRRFRKNPKVH